MTVLLKLHELERVLELLICSAKESYISDLVHAFSSEPKRLFRYLKVLKKSPSSAVFVDTNSKSITDPLEIANAFNDFFHSTFTLSDFVLPSTDSMPTPCAQLSCISIDSSDVFQALLSLSPEKAMGWDDLAQSEDPKSLCRLARWPCCRAL